jgi:Fe-S-cluster-containing hydrogenase component 2
MDVPTHSIVLEEARCVGCVDCCKACPTKAIRVRNDLMQIDPALCIDCGACIRACRYDAVHPRTSTTSELKRFRYTVAIPSMTLFAQFGRDVYPWQVAGALAECGFDAFHDSSLMCPTVSSAVDTYLSECPGPWPKISVTCPAIIRLILIRYPDLIPHLIPIHTPRELAAKLARRQISARLGIPPAETGVFYISPCAAILQSIQRPVGVAESYFDGAFSVAELYGPLLRAIRDGATAPEEGFDPRGLLWAASGGETGAMRNLNTLSVTGVEDVTYVFDCIEAGKFQQVDFLEAYICPDGCVSGQLLVEGRYAARHTLQRILAHVSGRSSIKEERVRSLFREHFFHMEDEIKARPLEPVASNLREAILRRHEKNRLLDELPHKDCAACGAPDCATLAEDIVASRARLDDCVFLRLKQGKSLPEETGDE